MTTATIDSKPAPTITTLLPIVMIVLLGFLCIGIPFAALPLYFRETLGIDNFWIGLMLGVQSVATLLTRHYAGTHADIQGPKSAVLRGLGITIASGLLSLMAQFTGPHLIFPLIFTARIVLGLGESLLITGALAWAVALMGPPRTGLVMAWIGIAMYTSIAASAPLSQLLIKHFGFTAAVAVTIIAPIIASGIAFASVATPAIGKERMPFYKVLNKVWKPGVGLSLSAVGFAGLAGFSTLYFSEKGWDNASLVMTTFGVSYVLARILFASAPDQYGGKKVGLISVTIEAIGLLLITWAPSPTYVFLGAALTGFGYSLVFPSFGVEAVKKVDPQFKGVALGAYVAFFDLALGITGPLAGIVANSFGYAAVYLFGVFTCAVSAAIASRI